MDERRALPVAAVLAVLVATWAAVLVVPAGASPRPAIAAAGQSADPDPVADTPTTGGLALDGSVTATTTAGGVIEGVVTVTNGGEQDLVRAALTIGSSTDETLTGVVVPPGWTCRDIAGVAGQALFCDAGLLAAGASSTFAFTAVAAEGLAVGDVVTTTVSANAETPVLDEQPVLVLTTAIVGAAAPVAAVAPVAATPRFTG